MSNQEPATILLIDDHPMLRTGVKQLISMAPDITVVGEASNGEQGIELAESLDPDLILLDLNMPGMNGLDAARAVLEQRPECKVIFVTAYSLFQYAHEAVHLGACDYLLKPVDPDELEASVRRAIRQIETERKLEELADLTPRKAKGTPYAGGPLGDKMIVLCGLGNQLDELLPVLRQAGAGPGCLKAVLTAHNKKWTAPALLTQLRKEQAMMQKKI